MRTMLHFFGIRWLELGARRRTAETGSPEASTRLNLPSQGASTRLRANRDGLGNTLQQGTFYLPTTGNLRLRANQDGPGNTLQPGIRSAGTCLPWHLPTEGQPGRTQ